MSLHKPNATELAALIERANANVMRDPQYPTPREGHRFPHIAWALDQMLRRAVNDGDLLLPELRRSESVAIYSDYAGEHPGAPFSSYSFLVCAWPLPGFHTAMVALRKKHPGTPRLEFKSLRSSSVQRVLEHYLTALDLLVPGLLCTVLVANDVPHLIAFDDARDRTRIAQAFNDAGIVQLKPRVAQRMLRIIHLSSYLTGLLAGNGQKLFWMTEHDAIVANKVLADTTVKIFSSVLGDYTGHTFPRLGWAVPFEERTELAMTSHDLLSAADLAAGCLADFVGKKEKNATTDVNPRTYPLLSWLPVQGVGLRKLAVLVKRSPEGKVQVTRLKMERNENAPPGTPVPVYV